MPLVLHHQPAGDLIEFGLIGRDAHARFRLVKIGAQISHHLLKLAHYKIFPTLRIDFKATKTIKLTELTNLQLQLYVYNLLNRYNPSTVYLGTGDPYITGYLNTAEGQKLGSGDQDVYQLAQRDPLNFDNPRMVRFGAVLNF